MERKKIEWRPIPGVSKYELSEKGQVRHIRTRKLVRGRGQNGVAYEHVTLVKDDGGTSHRSVRSLLKEVYPERA